MAALVDIEQFQSRAVSNYGSGDRCHLGHILLQSLADHPDVINQIDAATGERETNASVLRRSVRLARALAALGLRPGDVLALSAPNHLDLCIPFYASYYSGLPVMGIDPTYKYDEIKAAIALSKPKIIFCQNDKVKNYEAAIKSLGLETKVITFREGECTMEDFINKFNIDEDVNNFKAADFDPGEVFSWLVSTSGSTGTPKVAALTGRVVYDAMMFYMKSLLSQRRGIYLSLSPVQWMTNYLVTLSAPLTTTTILKTSATATTEHVVDIINKYKPNFAIFSPPVITQILKQPDCDFTSLELINVGGSKVYKDLIINLKSRTKGKVTEAYGQSECLGLLYPAPDTPLGSCGKCFSRYKLKLVDPETKTEINEPNIPGELHVKGPIFSEYYNNPEETAKAFTEDGWFKTGDILYKDENDFYYFVERMKMLIKYRGYHVHPTELEEVIRELPEVVDAAVIGVPNPQHGEVPAACVVRRPGSKLTGQDIKNLIRDRLSDAKQLRGGVVFVDSLPLTSTGKIARNKLMDIIRSE